MACDNLSGKDDNITRRAEAEAKAMAIGNIADVWRLNTASPLQKRRAAAFGNGHSPPESAARCSPSGRVKSAM